MFFSGLKLRIAGNLFLLLLIAIIWGNLITLVFWQQSLVRQESERVQQVLHMLASFDPNSRSGATRFTQAKLNQLAGSFTEKHVRIAYYNGSGLLYSEGEQDLVLGQVVSSAGRANRVVKRIEGSTWGIITFGKQYLILAEPITNDQNASSALGLRVDLGSVYELIRQNLEILLLYLLLNTVIFAIVGLYRFINLAVTPVERMAKATSNYKISDGSTIFVDESGSEFGQLSMALNSMLLRIEMDREQLRKTVHSLEETNKELINTQKKMVLTEKLAAVGRLSAGLAHEIGNPLGIVNGYLELLSSADINPEDRQQFAQRGLQELARIDRLIRQLLDFARARPESFQPFNLSPLITELIEMMSIQRSGVIIKSIDDKSPDDLVIGEKDSIRQVLLNCLLNATDSIKSSGNSGQGLIEIQIGRATGIDSRTMVTVEIRDNGTGIDDKHAELLFDPFFSTKESEKGTGLGLSVSQSIIEAHSGEISIINRESEGAMVTIALPAPLNHENDTNA